MPATSYGPRLTSVMALGTGAYRRSKRMVVSFCADGLGVELALGEVCQVEQTAQALDLPVQEAQTYVQTQDANVDETSWWEHERRGWRWVAP